MLLSPARGVLTKSLQLTFPFGFSPTHNVLKGFDFSDYHPSEPASSLGAPLARFGRMIAPSPGSLRFAVNPPVTFRERSECPP